MVLTVWGTPRDDEPWFAVMREVLDANDDGKEPGHSRHGHSDDPV